jgi:hypothetical protein
MVAGGASWAGERRPTKLWTARVLGANMLRAGWVAQGSGRESRPFQLEAILSSVKGPPRALYGPRPART